MMTHHRRAGSSIKKWRFDVLATPFFTKRATEIAEIPPAHTKVPCRVERKVLTHRGKRKRRAKSLEELWKK
jgi:hypothetical protein